MQIHSPCRITVRKVSHESTSYRNSYASWNPTGNARTRGARACTRAHARAWANLSNERNYVGIHCAFAIVSVPSLGRRIMCSTGTKNIAHVPFREGLGPREGAWPRSPPPPTHTHTPHPHRRSRPPWAPLVDAAGPPIPPQNLSRPHTCARKTPMSLNTVVGQRANGQAPPPTYLYLLVVLGDGLYSVIPPPPKEKER